MEIVVDLPFRPIAKKTGQRRGWRTMADGRRVPAVHPSRLARVGQDAVAWFAIEQVRRQWGGQVPVWDRKVSLALKAEFGRDDHIRVTVWPRSGVQQHRWDVHNCFQTIADGFEGIVYANDAQLDSVTLVR